MRQILTERFEGFGRKNVLSFKKSSFLIFRFLFILFSCTYCDESSFNLSDENKRNLNSVLDDFGAKSVGLLINNGDEYTSDSVVNLTFRPGRYADEMFISLDSDCSQGSWEALKNNKLFELKSLNQKNTVYVKYRFLGEEETSCTGDSIVHDNIAPEVEFTNQPQSWIAQSSLTLGIRATDSGSGIKWIQCDKQGEGQFETCGQSMVYNSLVENQNYLLVIRAQDKAGNFSRPRQVDWRSDQTAPSVRLSLGPAAVTADTTPDFIFLSNDAGSGVKRLECRLDGGSFQTCQDNHSLSGLSDGAHSLEVRAVDKVGHVSSSITHSWSQDTTAPTVHFIEKPDSVSKEQTARFRFTGSDNQGIVSYQCELDGGGRQACTSPHNLTGLSDGYHTFSVIGSDGVGNSSSPITYRWLVDTTKPTLVLVQKPQPAVNVTDVRFSFNAQDGGSGLKEIQCKIDGGRYQVCTNPKNIENLSEGDHSLIARSLDKAGNYSDEVSHQWIVDQTKPTVTITSKPNDPINSKQASFSFSAQDSGSGIGSTECRLDGGSFQTCQDPKNYTNLSEVAHTFSLRAKDKAGNVSTVATHSWSVDVTGPRVEFTQKPDAITTNQTAQFQFEGINGEAVSSYECQLDGHEKQACNSPHNLTGLSDGVHRLSVTGFDALENPSDPLVHVWTVDTIRPTLALTEKPGSLTNSKQARFGLDAQDGGSGIKEIQCKLDSGSYQVCTSPMNFNNLSDGSHILMAYSVDRAGNQSSVLTHTWSVDTTASSIRFTQKPDAVTKIKTARFQFSEAGSQNDIRSYECQLDGAAAQACNSPHNLNNLSDGNHTFSVTGLDSVSNRSAAISYTWMVDTTKPTLAFTEKPEAVINSDRTTFGFNAQDGGSGIKEIQCKVDSGSYQVCPNPMDVTNLSGGNHSLTARSVDRAGNISDEISHQWSVDKSLPVVSILTKPDNPTKSANASFTFSAQDSGSGIKKVECRLDNGSFEVCQDAKSYTNLAEGEHNFSLRAEDNGGNLSSVETYTWSVDTTAPTLQFSTKPDAIVYIGQTAQIRFSGTDANGVNGYQCLFNGNNYPCAGETMYSFHATNTQMNSFQVTVSDNAGNQSTETIQWQTKIEAAPKQVSHEVLEEVPVDILFVVDTSGSMNEERANLGQRIDGFINQINDMDWQIATTTTDVVNSSRDHTQGRLTDFDPGSAETYILDSSISNAQTLFGNRIQSGGNGFPGGSDTEKGIEAAYRAIQRYNNNETRHRQFFREGAHLAIVVLSDEEAQGRYTPQQFLSFAGQSFPNKTIAWYSIVNSQGQNYKRLSNLTGGSIGNVAASNYTSQLTDMGEKVKDLQKEITLGCDPLDDNLDGNIDMEIMFKASGSNSYQTLSESYTIQGQRIVFDDYLDPGDYQFNFNCAKE